MLCRAVGAGDSLLLLLGDSVESKGRVSVLGCAFSGYTVCLRVRVDVFFQDKAKMELCDLVLPFLSSGAVFLRLHRCC